MDSVTWGFIFIIVLLALILLIRMPIGLAMALSGALGIYIIGGFGPLADIVSHAPFSQSSEYVFTVIPMFVLMGWLSAEARVSADLFVAMNKWMGWMRGGLAMAVSWACAAFGAVCGCAITTAVTMTSIALPEMRKHNYSDTLSTGILSAGGNLGFLIPPSICFIIYGIITETSIGRLFMAGFVPGILLSILYCIAIYTYCRINPKAGPPSPRLPLREMINIPLGAWITFLIMLVVLGGIYLGVFTTTEAGAIGAFATLVFGLAARRFTRINFMNAMYNTVKTTGMILMLIIGANIFKSALALSTLPVALVNMITQLSVNGWIVLIAILVLYVILGLFLDIMSMLLILLPLTFPLTSALGFNPIWVGVLTTITVLMGQISPPVGLVVFAVGGAVPDVPVWTIFKGVTPFFIAMGVCIVILMVFPEISLVVPNMMFGR
jgi:tripartite ATP-independent transporter DctM subunit